MSFEGHSFGSIQIDGTTRENNVVIERGDRQEKEKAVEEVS
jgi:hypothetical protein